MAAEVFVDAGVWFAAACPRASDHAAGAAALRETRGEGLRLVTTNLVIAEAHALLVHRLHRAGATAFLKAARVPTLVMVSSTQDLEERAISDWIERYDDQGFSLTDAVSFAVMAERGIEEALAFDRHFRVAGFRTRPAR